MKYYLDTEFNEDFHKPLFGRKRHFIDLISIGLTDEAGRQYYAIYKDFNLKAAWNKWQPRTGQGDRNNHEPRHYWLRENVLRSIFVDLKRMYHIDVDRMQRLNVSHIEKDVRYFTYKNLKWLLSRNGKSMPTIANDICAFIYGDDCGGSGMSAIEMAMQYEMNDKFQNPEFYAYYADYDWVLFCSIFGTMMQLPKGFPMYCKDLKQTLDEIAEKQEWYDGRDIWSNTRLAHETDLQKDDRLATLEEKIKKIKENPLYPRQSNEHNAIDDAIWNKKLHEFLTNPIILTNLLDRK